jgi:ribosomal-protein-alanine acetyltransferase
MIREATLTDIGQILEIENQSFGEDSFNKRQFVYLIARAKGRFLVIEVAGRILAYISLSDNKRYAYTRLYSIAVRTEARGQKLSEALMDAMIEHAEKKQFKAIRLEVREDNLAAINLYKKYDFKVISLKKHYYHDGSNAILMKKTIEPKNL